jgi:hypothetical protein
MKIGVGDANVPGNEAMRADVDLLLGHDQGAIEQCEIADRAASVLANGERAAGLTRNMVTNNNRARFLADHFPKNLRALAVEAFTEFHIWRNWVRPPILLHMSIRFDVAHVGNFPEANSFA